MLNGVNLQSYSVCYIRTYVYDAIGSDINYDYEEYTVRVPLGVIRASFDIMIINNDDLTNEYELFNISISSITNGHIIGNQEVATVTIIRTTGE